MRVSSLLWKVCRREMFTVISVSSISFVVSSVY